MSTRTLLDRLDAALASCTAKAWSELLEALAVAGQSAGGVPCILPDPAGEDRRVSRQPGAAAAELPPDDVQ